MSGTAQDLDGNGRTALGGIVPGSGYITPQLAANPQTDSLTGHLYSPLVVSAAQVPAIVQKAKNVSSGGVASLAQAFASSNIAGNSIIVVCGVGNGTLATVTDTAGNTYKNAVNGANSTTFSAQIFYATNILAGANTVTVTPSASVEVAMQIYEVSGLISQTGNILDQNSSGSGTGTTATASNIASVSPNAMAFMGVGVGTTAEAVTATTGSFWTVDSSQTVGGSPSGLFSFGALSQPFGGIGSIVSTATVAASKPWAAAVATFKPVLLGIEGTVQIGGYNYTRVTTAATTLVKTGPGVLHAVVLNKLGASATIELDDALTNTTPVIGLIALPATITAIIGGTFTYDAAFSTGLSVTVGTATVDATVLWK